jgi:hypothetical protein
MKLGRAACTAPRFFFLLEGKRALLLLLRLLLHPLLVPNSHSFLSSPPSSL